MILVDTSVWLDHLRKTDERLVARLEKGEVLTHAFVIGEIALGLLKARETVLGAIGELPQVVQASDEEVLHLIDRRSLFGAGLGYVDAHLLAAAALSPGTTLWTRDKALAGAARRMGLAASVDRR